MSERRFMRFPYEPKSGSQAALLSFTIRFPDVQHNRRIDSTDRMKISHLRRSTRRCGNCPRDISDGISIGDVATSRIRQTVTCMRKAFQDGMTRHRIAAQCESTGRPKFVPFLTSRATRNSDHAQTNAAYQRPLRSDILER